MINIWKADFYRLKKSKSFYLYWFFILFTFGITIATKLPGGIHLSGDMRIEDSMKVDLQQVAGNFTFYYLFLFPVFGFICCEFGEKTIKNTISSAISRKDYFVAKYLLTECYILVTFFLSNFLYYGANRLINGTKYSSPIGEFAKAVCAQIPLIAGAGGVLILVAFLVKKTAAFNAITMIFPILYSTIALSVYAAGQEKFATEVMLKYELGTALSHIVSGGGSNFVYECAGIGLAAVVISFVAGYFSFTQFEMN